MIHAAILTPTMLHKTVKSCTRVIGPDSRTDHDERTVQLNLSSTARPFLSAPIPEVRPVAKLYCGHRQQAVVGAGKELRPQKRAKDCAPCFGIETEQALGLGRREPETGHLEVFRADSAQQFCR
jgi:hypothetical protein